MKKHLFLKLSIIIGIVLLLYFGKIDSDWVWVPLIWVILSSPVLAGLATKETVDKEDYQNSQEAADKAEIISDLRSRLKK